MMIRFQPDTLGGALLRYFDMAAPDANVYIEIPAPDIRFAAIALLAIAFALCWRRLAPARAPVLAMLVLLFASTALWLLTTGNGRYFMAMLVCAGPIAIALIHLLPLTRAFRATLALLLVAGQAFLLVQQTPWDSWAVKRWSQGSYFDVRLGPEELQAPPTTYASLPLLTYSLIAPQFPPESRWISLHAMGGTPRDDQWTDDFLREAAAQGPVKLIAPSIPSASLPNGLPNAVMLVSLDRLVAARNLKISGACRLIASPGLVAMAEQEKKDQPADVPLGFWTCPVDYLPRPRDTEVPTAPPEDVLAVYRKMSEACPRFFPPHESKHPRRVRNGWTVNYGTQTRLHVLDEREVWYQFWRNFNAVRVGTVADILAGRATVDCSAIRNDGAWRTGAQ